MATATELALKLAAGASVETAHSERGLGISHQRPTEVKTELPVEIVAPSKPARTRKSALEEAPLLPLFDALERSASENVNEAATPASSENTPETVSSSSDISLANLPEVTVETVSMNFSRPHGKRFGMLVHAMLSLVDLEADRTGVECNQRTPRADAGSYIGRDDRSNGDCGSARSSTRC